MLVKLMIREVVVSTSVHFILQVKRANNLMNLSFLAPLGKPSQIITKKEIFFLKIYFYFRERLLFMSAPTGIFVFLFSGCCCCFLACFCKRGGGGGYSGGGGFGGFGGGGGYDGGGYGGGDGGGSPCISCNLDNALFFSLKSKHYQKFSKQFATLYKFITS